MGSENIRIVQSLQQRLRMRHDGVMMAARWRQDASAWRQAVVGGVSGRVRTLQDASGRRQGGVWKCVRII